MDSFAKFSFSNDHRDIQTHFSDWIFSGVDGISIGLCMGTDLSFLQENMLAFSYQPVLGSGIV